MSIAQDFAALDLNRYMAMVNRAQPLRMEGEVVELVGLVVESRGPAAAMGDFCEIRTRAGRFIRTQVVGFREGRVLSMPLEETDGLCLGDPIIARGGECSVDVSPQLLGRVLDGFGNPIDGGHALFADETRPLYGQPPGPLDRAHIDEPLVTGIRAIDGLLTCGKGQRIGIFGGSGVGKSTLLGSMARSSSAGVNVIAMIGERNREVPAFLEHDLGPEGMRRSVVVVATSDRPAPLRVRACFVALAIAEYFRDRGEDVLLVMDSITRLAMAQREIGLAAGEPPSQKGYTPSVFSLLPRVCERAGNFQSGSITAFFTVLVEGDDFNEPICDAVRAILDGHITLARELGAAGHYPAIEVLDSVSRLQSRLATPAQSAHARKIREALALYRQSEDLINLGAYVSGSNPKLDAVIRSRNEMMRFLRQAPSDVSTVAETIRQMGTLAELIP
ncbi:MAG TPA: FliI/YscN family ATPase [Bryobacteraceae bacterium]|jgi:FliI/YscN family ATPase|nr:FliI/YscN family ATPase [Bryobacteraceae bacterium]